MFWKSHLQLELKSYSLHHVDMVHLSEDGKAIQRVTGVYGYPNNEEKHKTWALLKSLHTNDLLWLCFGDFNEILGRHEKTGNNGKNQALIGRFQEAIQLCELQDMDYSGHAFTWSNNRSGEQNVQERLDRFIVNATWIHIYSWYQVSYLPKRRSDHLPILLDCCHLNTPRSKAKKKQQCPCRFEKAWTQVAGCEELIKELWEHSQYLSPGDRALHCCRGK